MRIIPMVSKQLEELINHLTNGNLNKQSPFIKEAIKLFKLTIKHDKLYLNPYQNLAYLYQELGELNKNAEKYQKLYNNRKR